MKAIAAVVAALALVTAGAVGALAASGGLHSAPPRVRAAGDIGVHGLWRIDVRSPSGKLVRRLRFHNTYILSPALAELLTGYSQWSGWAVSMITTSASGGSVACAAPGAARPASSSAVNCIIATTGFGSSSAATTLTASHVGNDIKLSGSAQLFFYGTGASPAIGKVYTMLATTYSSGLVIHDTFTRKDLGTTDAPTIPITDGMFVTVNITLSFGV